MRRALLLLVALWPVAGAALAATTHDVAVRDNLYEPATVTVAPGDTVRWTNRGLNQHTVTFTGQRGAEPLRPLETHEQRFDTAGTYRYFCEFHPSMQGTVVVRSTGPSTTSTTEPPGGSARRGSQDTTTTTSTTTTTTTTTTVPEPTTTTTTAASMAAGPTAPGDDDDTDVDGAAAVAALLLLASGAGALWATRAGWA